MRRRPANEPRLPRPTFLFAGAPLMIGWVVGIIGVIALIRVRDLRLTQYVQELIVAVMFFGMVLALAFYLLALVARWVAYHAGIRRPLPWMLPALAFWWIATISLGASWFVFGWQLVTNGRLWA